MSQYYLIAQLPSLDSLQDGMPLPISEERFGELCERFLSKRELKSLNALTLMPDRIKKSSGSAFADKWSDIERELRTALALARAEKMGKVYSSEGNAPNESVTQLAKAAASLDDPMKAEQMLFAYRMERLEGLRPDDPFSDSALYYYAVKLKLLTRQRSFDRERGRESYNSIYSKILAENSGEDK